MKQSLLIVLSIIFLAACGGAPVDEPATETDANEAVAEAPVQPQVVELTTLVADTAPYVGQVVSVTGTVDHVCKHGGKRLFIMADDPEVRFKITAGEAVGAFERELEGSTITVTGIVEEEIVDEAYIDTLETEATTEEAEQVHHETAEPEAGEHEAGEGDRAAHLRQMLADSGSDHLSFYSLDCSSYDIVE